jgi:hypothetical protein
MPVRSEYRRIVWEFEAQEDDLVIEEGEFGTKMFQVKEQYFHVVVHAKLPSACFKPREVCDA